MKVSVCVGVVDWFRAPEHSGIFQVDLLTARQQHHRAGQILSGNANGIDCPHAEMGIVIVAAKVADHSDGPGCVYLRNADDSGFTRPAIGVMVGSRKIDDGVFGPVLPFKRVLKLYRGLSPHKSTPMLGVPRLPPT